MSTTLHILVDHRNVVPSALKCVCVCGGGCHTRLSIGGKDLFVYVSSFFYQALSEIFYGILVYAFHELFDVILHDHESY